MSNNMAHERLRVYHKALSFVRLVAPEVDGWPSSHSVRDQIDRAMESSVTNLAKAAWLQPSRKSIYYLECSLGSVLETAACLDVAWIYDLIDKETATSRKLILWEIASMEIGLRKVWCSSVREEAGEYGEKLRGFPHETLSVYQRGGQLCQVLVRSVIGSGSPDTRYARRIGEASTSLLLNIAEGNGRFSQMDHHQFLANAEESCIKLATYLDLLASVEPCTIEAAKALLHEVMAMLGGMKGYLENEREQLS